MRLSGASLLAAVAITGLATPASAQVQTLMYDHVHMAVPDIEKASAWYNEHIGGEYVDGRKDRLLFGRTRIMFLGGRQGAAIQPSAGSVIDHLGFSFKDLDAKVKELEAAGAKVTTPARDIEGLFRLAFVEDPWGTRLELVQDTELLGFHHVHLRAPDPEAAYKWYLATFGGERARLKGRLDAVRYPGAPFVWLLIQKGEARPSRGSSIDHIGWRAVPTATATMNDLTSRGVKLQAGTQQPTPMKLPNGTIHFFYVEGPDGARIELVEREPHMK